MHFQSEHRNPRADRRTKIFLAATIQLQDLTYPVKIRDISPTGALIEATKVPDIGTTLILSRGSLAAAAEVVWAKTDYCGVHFTNEVDEALWLAEVRTQRNGGPSPMPSPWNAESLCRVGHDIEESTILSRIAEEISYLGRVMEDVSTILSGDALLRHRHARSIQELTIGEEKLDQLAVVLNSSDKVEAIKEAVMGPMRTRLLRSPSL